MLLKIFTLFTLFFFFWWLRWRWVFAVCVAAGDRSSPHMILLGCCCFSADKAAVAAAGSQILLSILPRNQRGAPENVTRPPPVGERCGTLAVGEFEAVCSTKTITCLNCFKDTGLFSEFYLSGDNPTACYNPSPPSPLHFKLKPPLMKQKMFKWVRLGWWRPPWPLREPIELRCRKTSSAELGTELNWIM